MKTVNVRIFGSVYSLEVEDKDVENIQVISERLDHKMRSIAKDFNINSPMKIAVLAALNFAKEALEKKDDDSVNNYSDSVTSEEIIALRHRIKTELSPLILEG